MPRPPPVTSATRPSSCPTSLTLPAAPPRGASPVCQPCSRAGRRLCQPWPVQEGSRKAIIAAFFAEPRDRHRQVRRVPASPRRRACSPKPRTRWPTPATRRCCSSAASGRRSGPTTRTRSDTDASATSGRSSWRSCCSAWVGCSRSTRASRRSATPTRPRTCRSRSASSCFAIVLESYSLRTAVVEARHVKSPDTSWWQFIRRTKSPELPVVLLEDVGAEIGLFLALTGVLLAHSPTSPAGMRSARSRSACCSSSSPSCSPSR